MSAPGSRSRKLIAQQTIAAAGTVVGEEMAVPQGIRNLAVLATFVYGAGGTAVKVYIQTSLDGGTSWQDIMCLTFTTATAKKYSSVKLDVATGPALTPTDVTLTDNTIVDGVLGDRVRCKFVSTGTYTGVTTLNIHSVMN